MTARRPLALILGVTSDIGRALARAFASEGYELIVTARDAARLQVEVQDLANRYDGPVHGELFDAENLSQHERLVQGLVTVPDVIVCVIGLMPPQAEVEQDQGLAFKVMATNYVFPALILELLAGLCQARGSGSIVGVSSVAGDRGRASNYFYGSSKAGFTAYLSGLRNRLQGSGVHVMTVKPGFVYSRMTESMSLPRRLTVQPDQVAARVLRAVKKKSDVVYVAGIWRWIMLLIRSLPEPVFKRTQL